MADYALRGNPPADSSRDQRRGARNAIRWIVVVVCIVLAGEILYHTVVTKHVVITKVMIDSTAPVSDGELKDLAGLAERASYFGLDPVAVAARLEDHPAVKSAAARKVFPDTVQLTVTGRRPLVISFASVGEQDLPVAIDEDGVAFQLYRDIETWNLPVISGIRFQDFSLGTRLPENLVAVLAQLHDLRLGAPTLFEQISEVRVSGAAGDAVELLVYPVGYGVPVRIEDELDASLVRYIIMVLDMFEREGRLQNIRELDFRGGQIVFRAQEE
ncbi:MAG: cell division protein FtsQ/DivIB [Spirochaetaceae bacterium]